MKNFIALKIAPLAFFAILASACEEDDVTTAQSPVQAITTILEKSDGTVEAELTIITTVDSDGDFVNDATDTELRIPGGAVVELVPSGNGKYIAFSEDNSNLEYIEDQTYRFTFDLEGEATGDIEDGTFIAVMDAPDDEVSFAYSELPEFVGNTSRISWTPANLTGIYTIRDSDNDIVYQNYDFSNSKFTGDKWARLAHNGSETLDVNTYSEAGDYSIEFCAVDYTSGYDDSLSAELGVLSGFLIGRCAEPFEFSVSE